MIEISFGKLLLLAIIALIVLGPEKLPHAARTAGTLLRRLRAGWDSVRAEVERELEIEEIRRVAREAAAQAEAAQAKLDLAQAQINSAVGKVQGTVSGDVAGVLQDDAEAPSPDLPPADQLMTGTSRERERGDAVAASLPDASAESAETDEVPRGHA